MYNYLQKIQTLSSFPAESTNKKFSETQKIITSMNKLIEAPQDFPYPAL